MLGQQCTYSGWSNDGHTLLIGTLDEPLGLILGDPLGNDGNGSELKNEGGGGGAQFVTQQYLQLSTKM